MPYPLGHRGFPELHDIVMVTARKSKTLIAQFREKFRGHPGLNQGPLDLQSNALPLSYIPDGETRFPMGIDPYTKKSSYHVRARAYLTTGFVFNQNCIPDQF